MKLEALLVNLPARYDLQLLVGVFYSDGSISFLPITMQLFGAIWYVVRLDLVLCNVDGHVIETGTLIG